MHAILPLALAGIACGALAASAMASPDEPSRTERQMERMLAGKSPGEAQRCIFMRDINGTSIIDEDTILYRVDSQTVYRNEIPGGCPGLQDGRAISTRQPSAARLCEGEPIGVFEPQTGVEYGRCAIGAFVPYTN